MVIKERINLGRKRYDENELKKSGQEGDKDKGYVGKEKGKMKVKVEEKKRETVEGILPAPVGPTIAVVVPAATVKLTCFKPL